jgi:hypothetical protein
MENETLYDTISLRRRVWFLEGFCLSILIRRQMTVLLLKGERKMLIFNALAELALKHLLINRFDAR